MIDRGLEPSIDRAIAAVFANLSLVNGTIGVWDAERRQQRSFPNTDLNVAVEPGTGHLRVNFVTSGYGGRWTAIFDRRVDPSTGERTMTAVFSELTLADLLPRLVED